jgi:endonuclease I
MLSAQVVTVVQYNLPGTPGNQATQPAVTPPPANITGVDMTRGAGLTPSAAGSSFSSSGFTGETTDYLEFGFNVASGFQVALDKIYIGTRSSGTGPGTVGIYSSLDSYVTPVITLTQGSGTFVNSIVDVSSLGTVTGNVRFRVRAIGTNAAGGGTTGSAGTFRLTAYFVGGSFDRNLQVTGTVSQVGGDTVPPLASTFAPLDNATNVPINSTLAVTFNEAVQKGTGNILIKRSSDDSTFATIDVTTGAVVVSGTNMTITPPSNFINSTGYYIEIPSGAIKDLANNNYAGISGPMAWNFTTIASDLIDPLATSFSPADDATGVSISTTPSITFNEPVKKGTGNILIKRSADNTVFETIAVSSTQVVVAGSVVTITPTNPFAYSTGYYIEIPLGAIEDLAGNDYAGLSGNAAWNFTTGALRTNHMATNLTSATGVARPTGGFVSADHYAEGNGLGTFAVYAIANFRFSKVDFLLPGSANIDNIVSAEYTLTTNDRFFSAGSELEFFLTTDQMNGDFTGKVFNTATINGINNANYTFAPVSLGRFPYTPATTSSQGGKPNTFNLNLSAVHPALLAQLNAGAEFSIILAATAANAAITYSGKNNTFDPGDPSLKLTVNQTPGTDNIQPLVVAFTPADDSIGFPPGSNLSIRFNELMQKGATGTISIFNAAGNTLVEAIDVNSPQVTVNNAIVTIDPTNPLATATNYYVQITSGALEDTSGNIYTGIPDTTTWNFATSQSPITNAGPFTVSENAPAGTVVGDLSPAIIGKEGIKYVILGGSGGSTMMKGVPGAGYLVDPVFTMGDTIEGSTGALNSSSAGNFSPPGTPDGLGAFSLNANTVRVFMNHEIEVPNSGTGAFPFTLANGTVLNKGGARISYIDIDKTSRRVVDGGLAISRMYDRAGNVVTSTSQLELGGLDRFCSASLFEPNSFGAGRGLVDRIYFAGEETSTSFGHPHGGTFWALDTSNGDLWAVPDMGRGSWENAALIDTGTTTHVAFLLGDDAQGRPLWLYVGQKNPVGNFLERNGLKGGQLYAWKADNGNTTPQQFNVTGHTRTGTWVAINAKNAGAAGTAGHDAAGYKNDTTLGTEANAANCFRFSRPEDLGTSPIDGTLVAFTSTGRGSLFPLDNWGDTYIVDLDFTNLAAPTASVKILYSGDDAGGGQFMTPEEGLRCPDNLVWSADGFIYVQEDQSNQVGNFGAAGFETSIWKLNATTGAATRITQTDRSNPLPLGSTDGDIGDFGNWESSGIIDVSSLFGEAPGELFLFDLQAHSIKNGLIASKTLYEGGQLCFLEKGLEQGAFAINPNSGAITVANPDAISLDDRPQHELRIQAYDGTNTTLDQVIINITNAPVATSNDFKFATYNTSMFRDGAATLANDLAPVTNTQAQGIARVIQRNNPDVILVNEFDYDAAGLAAKRFKENYLEVAQNGENPVYYPYMFVAPSNTGIHSGFDLDNNGSVVSTPGATGYGEDALGFGTRVGQYSFVVFSKFPIDTANIRTFQKFLWKDMPGALLPDNPNIAGPGDWYSPDELNVFRLSSKNHADIPVLVNGTPVHILASHPTPPVFDDPGSGLPWIAGVDHNGRRNSDEIRFWSDYINPTASAYIYDDTETVSTPGGGLPPNSRFIICGDQNADNNEGDSTDPAIKQLIGGIATVGGAVIPPNPYVNSTFVPGGGSGPQPDDTAGFSGGVRVDYALPSAYGLTVNSGAVFWPPTAAGTISDATAQTDHYMVHISLSLSGVTLPPNTNLATYYAPASGLTGSALQTALHNIIDDHVIIDYGVIDDMMRVIDEASPDTNHVRLIYSNATLPKTSANISGGWNREHVWPRSDGVGDDGPDYSDLHHLFPCKDTVNSLRSNDPFDVSTNLHSDPFAPESWGDNDSWEPLNRDKGLVARALLYMMVRYDGGEALTTDLQLADNPSPVGTHGVLSTLRNWHKLYPPTDYERSRNNAIYGGVLVNGITRGQGNRNPFVDFPQFADALFLNATTTSFSKWQLQRFTIAQLQNSALTDPNGDADGDGRSNYFEFLLGGDPNAGSDEPLAAVRSGNNLTLTFRRPTGITEQARIEVSTDLINWTTVPGWEAASVITDEGDYQRLDYTLPITNDGKFYRVVFQ